MIFNGGHMELVDVEWARDKGGNGRSFVDSAVARGDGSHLPSAPRPS